MIDLGSNRCQHARGAFITLEGIDGVGKTTQIEVARTILCSLGIDIVVTREPGGTQIAEHIRELLLASYPAESLHEDTELLLMFAARNQHLTQLIRPALSQGKWILCDRFTDATYAYQGAGRGINRKRIAQLEHWIKPVLQPDLTLLLDAPVEVGMARVTERNQNINRFDRESLDFFNHIRSEYLYQAECFPQRFVVVDASQSLATVSQYLRTILLEFHDQWIDKK